MFEFELELLGLTEIDRAGARLKNLQMCVVSLVAYLSSGALNHLHHALKSVEA